ncbi:MAG: lipoprotein signal peptidase [Salibacteraceae bacterium]
MKSQSGIIAALTVLAVIIIDQGSKIWVKTSMYLGQEFAVAGNWFFIHFTENNGMAFGMEFAGEYGKLFLTGFRILAVVGILYYLVKIIREGQPIGLVISIALVFSGALGNILDSVFYGVMFNDSYHQIATLGSEAGGYSTWFYGKVVDMLYFPMVSGIFPDWMPIWGGEPFLFFRPVFNVADTAISTGVGMIVVFQKRYFS